MSIRSSLVLACALLFLLSFSFAQEGKPKQEEAELPAAPSAVRTTPQPAPAPPPETAPETQPAVPPPTPLFPDEDDDEDDEDEVLVDDEAEAGAEGSGALIAPPRGGAADLPRSAPRAGDEQFIYSTQVDEVNVVFTVTDRRGRFVKDLTQDDIRVLDDEKPPSAIIHFTRETDLPLRVGLLVDASNSIRDRFRFQQEAAIEFLNRVVRRGYDQAFVLGFDSTAEITQDFTDDTNDLSDGIRMLRPGGGTALYDALFYAARDKLGQLDDDYQTRRAIVLLSDGDDNQSRVTREEAIDMALRAEVVVYAISTNVSGVKSRGDRVLERIAEATGGRVFFPFRLRDVANALEDIQAELRSQYAVAYRPAEFEADGRFRTIEILTDNRRLQVRARRGYYAPQQ
jgi:Ca-activated chloride channel homolog